MLTLVLANFVAGLGLFFSGLKLIDLNLRQSTGRQLRTVVGRLTRHPAVAALVGVVAGAVVQSASGIAFILVSLVSSGLTTVRRALPILTWANVGCCALIYASVLDLRISILYLLGLAGAAFAFDRSHKSHALAALFGIGILFYGLELMKQGAEPLRTMPALTGLLHSSHQAYWLALVGGTTLAFVTQSSTAVAVLAIGLVRTGLVGSAETMMAIYGANLGSTFARMVLSGTLRGAVRQITAYQDAFKITGTVLFVALFYLEIDGGMPLVGALASRLSPRLDRQMAGVYLLFNLSMAVLFTVATPLIVRLLERWRPAAGHDDLSQPEFLYDEAIAEPATALDLIEREQLRLARRLRAYPAAMRTPQGSAARALAVDLARPFEAVALRIDQFQRDLLNQRLGQLEMGRLTRLQSRLSLIVYLEESLRTMTRDTETVRVDSRLTDLLTTFIEALDFVLMLLTDALAAGNGQTIDLLTRVTEDRGDLMERVRHEFLADEVELDKADRALLLQITGLFERVIWIGQRLSRLVDAPDGAVDRSDLTPTGPIESAVERETKASRLEPAGG